MSICFPLDSSFFSFLRRIDEDLASLAQARGCSCGGKLHHSDYPRKPRGGPSDLPEQDRRRISFCCDQEGCRHRVTPPSVRFLSRKVYFAAVVLLSIALRQGPSPPTVRKLHEWCGASRRTLARWRTFWQETFPKTRFFRSVQGLFLPSLDRALLPLCLLQRFGAIASEESVKALLRFLSPITTHSCEPVEPSPVP